MFPLNSNQAYIKKTGERTTLGAVIGGGGGGSSELPEYSAANAGQVLTVNVEGKLTWAEVQGGATFTRASNNGPALIITPSAKEVTT